MSPRTKSPAAASGGAGRPRRGLRPRAAALRNRLMQRFFLPLRRGRAARLHYAAILDGQTVNLHAQLPPSVRLPERAEVVLRRGRRRFATEARVYEGPADEVLVDAVVLLGADVGGAPVGQGRWRLRLRLHSGRRSRTLPLLLFQPPVPYEGPTKPMTASPVTGERHRIGRSFRGSARVISTGARPSAEVAKVHLTHAGVTVDFRLLGTRAEEPWAEFVASGRRIEQPVTPLAADTYRVEVPLDQMPPRGSRPDHWDVVLCDPTGLSLRLGRRLHDVRNPLRVFAMRSLAITPSGRPPMIVQPRYTPAGNLRVTCTRMPEAG
ncbi:hypothetical protein [Streptomyces griseomycini]|uniref:Uncharacterized protein n=1 Tax=Streptomyces griseomycini TaxID=66895 RepID=A0A7W7LZL7_9ACTN|nr:hypothetical protein [Streptomyces griseomycini]MBB4898636.1 hypothetical protein [Streptomyces griseomycini]GGQ02830.1 hypothetical protein GCM10010266_27800 [Streptomyces griseomycini]GGR19746.1 hypothetical protein GCM10015536_26800 [Streptomyces griseomycini]